MRIQFAAPILTLSAVVMLAGLDLAEAQQNTPARPQAQTASPGTAPLRPAARRNQEKARSQAQRENGRNQPGGARPGAGGGDGDGTSLRPFETGIEYRRISPRTRVTFNLEDADLPDLVRLISNMTGKRFILPGKVRSIKASVFAPTKVSVAEAYSAFLSILEVNGMTVVPTGRYLKIVETQGIEGQPLPTYPSGTSAPRDARFITRLIRLENVTAEDVVQLLSRFKSSEGSVTAYAPTNTLFITDTGANIRRMQRVLQEIDIPNMGERVWIEPVHYAEASRLAERLQEIFPVGDGAATATPTPARPQRPRPPRPGKAPTSSQTGSQPNSGGSTIGTNGGSRITKIMADERTNSLIIMATESAYLRILRMIRRLDIPLEGEGGIHVHYLQHGDAEQIATTLQSLVGGGSGASPRTGGTPRRPTSPSAAQRQSAAAGAAGGTVFQGDIRVTAHKPSNALVITASLHDYNAIRRVIDRLDSPRRQVFIEAVIMEVLASSGRSFGLSFHGGAPDVGTEGSLSVFGYEGGNTASGAAGLASLLTGTAFGIFGPEIPEANDLVGLSVPSFGVALNAAATSSDVDILSTPHLMAMDNVQAEITIGENIPLQTSGLGSSGGLNSLAGLSGLTGGQDASSGAAGLAGLAGLAGGLGGSLPRQDVGTTLRILPHINDSGQIRMEIEQEISSEGARDGPNGAVSINRRTAKTQVVVRDQETVVIGGQVRESLRTTETRVPILGDIPLIGALFRQTQTDTVRSNLLLFLTPYVIRDHSDLRRIFERKMQERQEFLDRHFVFGEHDFSPHVDYTRTRGLVMEIIQELGEIEEERAMIEAAAAEPPPTHVPRPPVDAEPLLEEGDEVIVPDGEEEASGEDAATTPSAEGTGSDEPTPVAEADPQSATPQEG